MTATAEKTALKVRITKSALQDALTMASRVIPTRATLPVLGTVLIEATPGSLVITGTNLDRAIQIRADADVEHKGELTAPARKLAEAVKEMPSGTVTLEATDGGPLVLSCGRARFKFSTIPAVEFPAVPKVKDGDPEWVVSGARLAELSGRVGFCASDEVSRPQLAGVFLHRRGNSLKAVATNGHKLSLYETSWESPAALPDLLIPSELLATASSLYAEEEGAIRVRASGNLLHLSGGNVVLIGRTAEGPYPHYEQVLPAKNDKALQADREVLMSAIRQARLVSSNETHRVKLALTKHEAKVSAQTADVGSAVIEAPVAFEDPRGEAFEIGFNADYLLELLKNVRTPQVRMTFLTPERAAEVYEVDAPKDAPAIRMVLMPMRLVS